MRSHFWSCANLQNVTVLFCTQMNVRSLPNETPTCALSRFPATPKGHPSAVDVPLLCYLSSLPPAEKPLSAASKTLLSHLISKACGAHKAARLICSDKSPQSLKSATCSRATGQRLCLQRQCPGLKTFEASLRSEACRACFELVYISKF